METIHGFDFCTPNFPGVVPNSVRFLGLPGESVRSLNFPSVDFPHGRSVERGGGGGAFREPPDRNVYPLGGRWGGRISE